MSPDALKYRDPSNKTQYYLGPHFKDFAEMNWENLIPESDRKTTLALFFDRTSSIKRVDQLTRFGFMHMWYDSNYNGNYGGREMLSFNRVCTAPRNSDKMGVRGVRANFEIPAEDDDPPQQKR